MFDHVLTTWVPDGKTDQGNKLGGIVHALMGLVGEFGETVDAIKKWIFKGGDDRFATVLDELGDLGYYAFALRWEMGLVATEGNQSISRVVDEAEEYVQAAFGGHEKIDIGDGWRVWIPKIIFRGEARLTELSDAVWWSELGYQNSTRRFDGAMTKPFDVFVGLCVLVGANPVMVMEANAKKLADGHGWVDVYPGGDEDEK